MQGNSTALIAGQSSMQGNSTALIAGQSWTQVNAVLFMAKSWARCSSTHESGQMPSPWRAVASGKGRARCQVPAPLIGAGTSHICACKRKADKEQQHNGQQGLRPCSSCLQRLPQRAQRAQRLHAVSREVVWHFLTECIALLCATARRKASKMKPGEKAIESEEEGQQVILPKGYGGAHWCMPGTFRTPALPPGPLSLLAETETTAEEDGPQLHRSKAEQVLSFQAYLVEQVLLLHHSFTTQKLSKCCRFRLT